MGYLQSSGSQDGADGVDADVVLAVFSSQTFRGLQVLFLPGQPEFIMTKSDQRESLTHIRNSTFAGVVPYQPGRGRVAPILEMLMMEAPPSCFRSCGMTCCTLRKMDLTLTAKTLSNSASVTSRVGYISVYFG